MAKNKIIRAKTLGDIDQRVERVIRGLGIPEPPLDLRQVRELLELDRGYYSADDPTLLQETVSRLRIAGKQVLKRPTLLAEAVRKLDLRALYIPDQKRILLDRSQPQLKHRWNEAHEIGHSLLPWHDGAMLGDDQLTLLPACHAHLESEANFAAGRLLFLRDRFTTEALDYEPSLEAVKALKPVFDNTYATTFWRCVETWGTIRPIIRLITDHPHPSRRKADFDPGIPCKHFIQSDAFAAQFSATLETDVFDLVADYCSASKGGPLGACEVVLTNDNGDMHIFFFESFSFHYNVLTLGIHLRPHVKMAAI